MITWKQEGSTWVGYIGERRALKIVMGKVYSHSIFTLRFHYGDVVFPLLKNAASLSEAKQAAEDFAAEMKQLFNTKEL